MSERPRSRYFTRGRLRGAQPRVNAWFSATAPGFPRGGRASVHRQTFLCPNAGFERAYYKHATRAPFR